MNVLSRLCRPLACFAVIVLALVGLAPSASAHAYLVKAVPAERATLFAAPARVQLWFNERLEPKFCTVSVTDSAGKAVDQGDLKVAPDDPKQLSVGLNPITAGTYQVKFRVLSVDGHVVENHFPFTVRDRR